MKAIFNFLGVEFVKEVPDCREEYFFPLSKNLSSVSSWSENTEASNETSTIKLVFRLYGDDVYHLVGYEK